VPTDRATTLRRIDVASTPLVDLPNHQSAQRIGAGTTTQWRPHLVTAALPVGETARIARPFHVLSAPRKARYPTTVSTQPVAESADSWSSSCVFSQIGSTGSARMARLRFNPQRATWPRRTCVPQAARTCRLRSEADACFLWVLKGRRRLRPLRSAGLAGPSSLSRSPGSVLRRVAAAALSVPVVAVIYLSAFTSVLGARRLIVASIATVLGGAAAIYVMLPGALTPTAAIGGAGLSPAASAAVAPAPLPSVATAARAYTAIRTRTAVAQPSPASSKARISATAAAAARGATFTVSGRTGRRVRLGAIVNIHFGAPVALAAVRAAFHSDRTRPDASPRSPAATSSSDPPHHCHRTPGTRSTLRRRSSIPPGRQSHRRGSSAC
jgi:hypothetical protein